ncbi:hypothetical protein EJV47_25785 [Hymenobacter gummosus]|uniref:DUF4097 domain-containing protein n=1 Tax=Hymenobacter gummosus TaxID=1776032 RepID=A0A3S0H269_9BACT|nr:DUF4097 family beta strand repeat-containing protein [Hymenobacter gummosus]RTQ45292.1 hypothetical protein EJV47_25785 [Hymenobacter gummosus]
MKKALLLPFICLLLATPALRAQEFKLKLGGKDRKIELDMQGSNVTLEGYNGDELIVRGNGYQPAPKRAEGLRAVYNAAEDNTRLGLSITQKDNVVRIVQASRKTADYVIRVPRTAAVVFNQGNFMGGDVEVRDLDGNIELNLKNAGAKLLNMGGGVVANTISGSITVRYADISKAPSSISSVSGDVDVTMRPTSKATLQLRSTTGEVYTDFDIDMGKADDNLRRVGGQLVQGTVNGGGTRVSLQSVSGDIFVRKAK